MKMKKAIKVLLGAAISVFIVVTAPFVLLRIYFHVETRPFEELRQAAEAAIADVGGYAVLAAEADAILAYAKEKKKGSLPRTYFDQNDWETYAPAMLKLKESLPQAVTSWIELDTHEIIPRQNMEEPRLEVPEHVTIRFGTHFSYAWITFFYSEITLSVLPDDVVHLWKSIYISPNDL